MSEGNYVKGKQEGTWKFYSKDGSLFMQGPYKAGKKEGEFTEYYPSGKVRAKGMYEGSKKMGVWNYYLETGALDKQPDFKSASIKHCVFYKNGAKDFEVQFLAAFEDRNFSELVEKNYNGKFIRYGANGKPIEE